VDSQYLEAVSNKLKDVNDTLNSGLAVPHGNIWLLAGSPEAQQIPGKDRSIDER
jgi:hypothetical protein